MLRKGGWKGEQSKSQGLVGGGNSQKYPLKNQKFSGLVGNELFGFRLSGVHLELGQALLEFGHYSGVGIKTAMITEQNVIFGR